MKEFQGYDQSHRRLHVYFRSLLEDHRRRHAAVEALKIGFGGVAYVARVLGMSRRTIYTESASWRPWATTITPHSVPVAVPSASAVLVVVVAKSPNANRGWRKW